MEYNFRVEANHLRAHLHCIDPKSPTEITQAIHIEVTGENEFFLFSTNRYVAMVTRLEQTETTGGAGERLLLPLTNTDHIKSFLATHKKARGIEVKVETNVNVLSVTLSVPAQPNTASSAIHVTKAAPGRGFDWREIVPDFDELTCDHSNGFKTELLVTIEKAARALYNDRKYSVDRVFANGANTGVVLGTQGPYDSFWVIMPTRSKTDKKALAEARVGYEWVDDATKKKTP